MSKEVLSPDSLVVGVLAGGRGERLQKITGEDTPKVLVEVEKGRTILDVVYEGLYDQGFRKFVFLLNAGEGRHGVEIYRHLLKKEYNTECLFEREGSGSAGAVRNLISVIGESRPTLILTADMILDWRSFPTFLTKHKSGTISCFVSSKTIDIMSNYNGMLVNDQNAVVGDEKLTWWNSRNESGRLRRVAKGGAVIFDPRLYIKFYKLYIRLCSQASPDFFTGVFPMTQELNRRIISRGGKSIMNAYDSEGVILDMGTPELLEFTKSYLKDLKYDEKRMEKN